VAVAEPISMDTPDVPRRFKRLSAVPQIRHRIRLVDQIFLVLFIVVAIGSLIAPWFAPHNPIDPSNTPLLPPGHLAWFGTDEAGRDVFSRVLYGMRTSWIAAIVVIASGIVIGGTIGLVAGAAGGWVDAVLMRITDAFLALPAPVLAIAVVSALGPSFAHVLLAVGIVWWPYYARIVRADVRALAARPHLEAARLAGTRRARLWIRHLLPGAFPTILVAASLDVGNLLLMLAGLSFLGLGAPQPAPELGSMTALGLPYLLVQWWVPIFPALAIFVLAFLANAGGDAVRGLIADR
jgi:peptide/nickel transport system permease protein